MYLEPTGRRMRPGLRQALYLLHRKSNKFVYILHKKFAFDVICSIINAEFYLDKNAYRR